MSRMSRSYCKSKPVSQMGFSQRSSCKAQGYIKRTSKQNKGKYVKSPKYKKSPRRSNKKSPRRSNKRSSRRSNKKSPRRSFKR